jgi:hypothetical protein
MARQTTRRSPVATAIPKVSKPRTAGKACCMPSEQQIRERAYEIFLRRNGGPGDARSDWVQAERELKEELTR